MDRGGQRAFDSFTGCGAARSRRSKKNSALLRQAEELIGQCACGFSSRESFARARRHIFSHLVCFGRHTITGLLRNQDRAQRDWTADYRLYSRDRVDGDKVFGRIRRVVEDCSSPQDPLVVAMDDSILRKTGRKIHGSRYQRDPLSPPFHVNLARGLRILQISAAVRQGDEGAARMIPVDFQHAALPEKPRKDAPAEAQAAYQLQRAASNINLAGRERLARLRRQMDEDGSRSRLLIATIDGRFTNSTVLGRVPERTTLVGRVRKDSAFYHPPEARAGPGRRRKYGLRAPTPLELLKDSGHSSQSVQAYAAGRRYDFKVKTIGPVCSRMDKGLTALRLIVVEPVPYRSSKSGKLGRREPAFLICTDPAMPLEQVLQAYLWRWDIEVNFRDEKTILGVGQAQVRSAASNQNAPALAVAAYAILLLASIKTYGPEGRPDTLKSPRWYNRKPKQRASTLELINQLRLELWSSSIQSNFQRLSPQPSLTHNPPNPDHPLHSALFLSTM